VTLDNHHLHPSAHSLTSLADDNHKLSRSVQDLLHKIPDDAESLTVLVGGVPFLTEPLVVFVRLKQSHLLGDLTEVPVPVRFIYLNIGPTNYMDYHEVGRAMATLMSDKCFHETAYSSLSKDEIMDAIDQFLDDSIVLPPGDWDPELILPIMHERNEQKLKKEKIKEHHLQHHEKEEEVKFSCKPCGGFVHDLKNLIRRYPSDIKDVFHIQAFLAIFFIYISCVAPAVAFGGLMEELSGTELGVTETLVGTGLCGIIYGLFSVQPLAILAFTGPLLLFEEIVLEFSHLLHIEYLSWRAWIGLWVMLFVILFSVFELTFLIKNFTRFSEEIFTGVIALFFTIEAVRTIVRIFERNPICGINAPCGIFVNCTDLCDCSSSNMTLNDSSGSGMMTMTMDENVTMEEPSLPHDFLICNQPNTALWSVFLCISVFVVAVILRKIRHGRFLSKQVRRLVSDFGMFTALLTLGLLAYFLRNTIAIEIIVVPNGWLPTNSSLRGWIINPLKNLEFYHIIGAIIPAFLLAVLICIENQLALFLIEKPEHELKKKGAGYHLDLCIVGVLTGICSIMGLPWHCAASIRSIQHLQALSYYSRRMAPGEKPQLAGVYEQRITNIAIHTLIILTPFAFPVLQQIPMSMLMGVFLYLAYASFSGIQLRKRIKLFFMPSKHHPDIHYVRKVKTWKMNLYTFIQVVCAGILIGLKNSPAGMLYPLVIVLMVPLRMFLGKFVYNQSEFEALNNEEDFPDEVDDDYSFTEFEITHVPY
jgi:anion exchange protein